MTEAARIKKLQAMFGQNDAEVPLGIGDDAAVIAGQTNRNIVMSVDTCVEGVHFEKVWLERGLSISDVITHAVGAAVSDIAAMGTLPHSILSSLQLPAWVGEDEFAEILEGYRRATEHYQVRLVGGNLSRAGELSICTTALGFASQWVARGTANLGDDVWLSGPVGLAAEFVGNMLNGESVSSQRQSAFRAWRWPPNRGHLSALSQPYLSSLVDLSDGLFEGAAVLVKEEHGVDLIASPGHATGEDYELLGAAAAVHNTKLAAAGWIHIGKVCAQPGVWIGGTKSTHPPHDHFPRVRTW